MNNVACECGMTTCESPDTTGMYCVAMTAGVATSVDTLRVLIMSLTPKLACAGTTLFRCARQERDVLQLRQVQ